MQNYNKQQQAVILKGIAQQILSMNVPTTDEVNKLLNEFGSHITDKDFVYSGEEVNRVIDSLLIYSGDNLPLSTISGINASIKRGHILHTVLNSKSASEAASKFIQEGEDEFYNSLEEDIEEDDLFPTYEVYVTNHVTGKSVMVLDGLSERGANQYITERLYELGEDEKYEMRKSTHS